MSSLCWLTLPLSSKEKGILFKMMWTAQMGPWIIKTCWKQVLQRARVDNQRVSTFRRVLMAHISNWSGLPFLLKAPFSLLHLSYPLITCSNPRGEAQQKKISLWPRAWYPWRWAAFPWSSIKGECLGCRVFPGLCKKWHGKAAWGSSQGK